MDQFETTQRGNVMQTIGNTRLAFKKLGVHIAYDEWRLEASINGEPLADHHYAQLREAIEVWGLHVGPQTIADAIENEARANKHNSMRDWLTGIEWDGVDRRVGFAAYFGADTTRLNDEVGWLIVRGMVARILEPGTQFQYMPILKGAQGVGKSQALRILGGAGFGEMPALDVFDLEKRLVEVAAGACLLESSEMAGLSRASIEKLKSIVSRESDKVRVAYGRRATQTQRSWVMVATSNLVELTDTENRRFPILHCDLIDLAGLARDRDQILAQAVVEHVPGPVRLSPDLWDQVAEMTALERVQSPTELALESYLASHKTPECVIKADLARYISNEGAHARGAEIKRLMEARGYRAGRDTKGSAHAWRRA